MAATYLLTLYSSQGDKLAILDSCQSFVAGSKNNDVGAATFWFKQGSYPLSFFTRDNWITIERAIGAGPLRLWGETVWFICAVHRVLDANGQVRIRVRAEDANTLLRRRIVPDDDTTTYATKTLPAEDLLKAIVREQLAAPIDATRTMAGLQVASNTGIAPAVTKSFSYREVLTTLQDVCLTSLTNGVRLSFAVVTSDARHFEFRTYLVARGVDRRRLVPIGPEFGNLANAELGSDWTTEANVVYAGGQGQGADRLLATVNDQTRSTASPYSRVEKFLNATSALDITGLTAEAAAELRRQQALVTCTGDLLETSGCLYDIHFGFGDLLTVTWDADLIDCMLEIVTLAVNEDGTEQVGLKFRSLTNGV